ncbi:MAG: ABC transporter ATP-binding protein [Thermodesulfobacteriota bacterium]
MTPPALALAGIGFAFPGGSAILEGISLAVAAGEILLITGPNGAGKTTLVRIMAGTLPASAGEVRLLGRPLARIRRRERARTLALVPQVLPAELPFTVRELVQMGRTPHQGLLALPSAADWHAAEAAMAAAEVSHLAARRLDRLSGGERQRVFVARALCQEPRILLLDEPVASLDLGHQLRLLDLLDRLRRDRGLTVVMVGHDLNLASLYADRLLLLAGGRTVALGPPAEVLTAQRLADVYGCTLRVEASPWPGRPRVTPVPARLAGGAPDPGP